MEGSAVLLGFAVRQDGVMFTQACDCVKQERRLHLFLPLPSTESLPLVGAMAADPVPSAPCSPGPSLPLTFLPMLPRPQHSEPSLLGPLVALFTGITTFLLPLIPEVKAPCFLLLMLYSTFPPYHSPVCKLGSCPPHGSSLGNH